MTNPDLIAFGLAISALSLTRGECRTCADLAIFCREAGAHCTRQRISQIEHKALKKVRLALWRDKHLDAELRQSLAKIFEK
jgi:hypothetical protein